MKILNLYAGIGGNRKLWPEGHEITAVEIDPKIAEIYQKNFPLDKVIVTDAHQFLLEHFKEFDFIWSSPPCPSHSRARYWGWKEKNPFYPDMRLYQEIIFLKHFFKGVWIVENVKPYYEPLILGMECGRHLMWANFKVTYRDTDNFPKDDMKALRKLVGFEVKKRELLRNCVNPKIGLHVWDCAFKLRQTTLVPPKNQYDSKGVKQDASKN